MTFLPIVDRELRVAARRPWTYRMRMGMAGMMILLAAGTFMVFGNGFFAGTGMGGMMIFGSLSALALLYCVVEGVRQTCDCLSREQRNGTLGLLFLTDLRGHDVVLGKFAAASLNAFYGLFAAAPVLALPLLMGGITPAEYWRMVLALVNALFFSLCLGMWVSSRSHDESKALFGSLGLMGAVTLLIPWLESLVFHLDEPGLSFVLSPLGAYTCSFESGYLTGRLTYWSGIAWGQVLGWFLLFLASRETRRRWQHPKQQTRDIRPLHRRKWLRQRAEKQSLQRRTLLDINPVHWLEVRRDFHPRWILGAIILVMVFYASSLVDCSDWDEVAAMHAQFAGWVFFFAKVYATWRGCRGLVEARESGALELLLTTPVTIPQIVRGQWLSFKRPAFAIGTLALAMPCLLILAMLLDEPGMQGAQYLSFGMTFIDVRHGFGWGRVALPVLANSLACMADVAALFWVGNLLALRTGRLVKSFFRTYVWVIFLPWLGLTLLQLAIQFSAIFMSSSNFLEEGPVVKCLWLVAVLVKDALFIAWARRRLLGDFRGIAATTGSPSKPSWWRRFIPGSRPPPLPA